MSGRILAFRIKSSTAKGVELACDRCPVVLQIVHDENEQFPQHRCGGKLHPFNIVLELDSPITRQSRIDPYWKPKE